MKNEKLKKLLSKTALWIMVALVGLLIIIVTYILVCNAQGRTANLFGRYIFKVATSSMEPSIHQGDYIIIESVDTKDLKVGDVICFYSLDEEIYDMPNTHRIVSITEKGFVTKGDSNLVTDKTYVPPERVIGKYTGKSRFLRFVNSFKDLRKLLLVFGILPVAVMSVYESCTVIKLGTECRKERNKRLSEEKEKLFREAVEKQKEILRREGFSPDENNDNKEA